MAENERVASLEAERARVESSWVDHSRQFLLARWISEYTEGGGASGEKNESVGSQRRRNLQNFFCDQWFLQPATIRKNEWDVELGTMGTAKVVRKLFVTGDFAKQFDGSSPTLFCLLMVQRN